MKNSTKVAFVSSVVLVLAGFASAQAVFTAVKVPGSSPNSMISINNGGLVVVNTGNSSSFQVSVWNRLSGAQSVGLIGNTSGGAAINSLGQVVGAGDPDNSGDLQSFLWQSNSGVQWLGSLGGNLSAASGLNDSDAVVGLSYNGADYQHAFLWTPANGLQDLTPDLTSIGGAFAAAINNSNEVVGYYFPNGSRNTVGFTWTETAGLQSFGPSGTLAFAVNAAGTVVGQSPFANANKHAFSWTQDGGITDLGTLGGSSSSATGINTLGWIVGTSLTSSTKGLLHGFLRTPTAAMKDLTTMAGLSANIQITGASVNDSGVIAASTNKGGYLLVPKMTAKFKSSANPSIVGQPVTFTATITSVAGAPPDGDTVQFSLGGTVLGTATLSGGVAQFTTSAIAAGSHAITANFSGDANYIPTKYANALTQVVNQ
ncbi:MAG: Ig-like domain repeat protein [Terriglobales bacterium]